MAEQSIPKLKDNKTVSNNEEEDSGITMVDVLEEEEELEEDANAVLGGSDDQNCTYSRGYVHRQALYACMTCSPPADPNFQAAAVCLACSYHCHEGHELVELYTKRNFRCDCGNSKFESHKCNLEPKKNPVNGENAYNHNFYGKYCTCSRPYPDPEDPVEDEMIQCIICEDWYHGRHLGSKIPDQNDYGEMICESCMKDHDFLWHYIPLAVVKTTSNESVVDIVGDASVPQLNGESKGKEVASAKPVSSGSSDLEAKQESVGSSDRIPTKACLLSGAKKPSPKPGAVFWPQGWRKKLCTCTECQKLYYEEDIVFITEEQDTVQAYEEEGKARHQGQGSGYEKGMQALSSLDRVRQVEAIHEYNNMKVELKDYLQKFAQNKKVVREEDIREFFSTMQARKKPRFEPPRYCH